MNCLIFTIFLLLNVALIHSKPKLPSFLKICRRSDPEIVECIKQSVEQLRPLLAEGIPELGVPSCEPLLVPEVTIDQGAGPVAVRSVYKDIRVYGPSEFVIKQIKIDMSKDLIKLRIWLPHLEVLSKYEMDGRILVLPISGKGSSRGNYSDIDATISIQGEKIAKDHLTYFHVKDFFVNFNIGRALVQFDDLFGGDKELGDAMNSFLNDNWKNIANEIKPVLEDTVANVFKKMSNKIYHKYPLELLLPE